MLLYRPPSSEPLILPVRYSTAPIDMNSRPLNRTSLNACDTAPLIAQSVPIPMPTDHEADLVDHAVGQHAAQVVLDHGIKDRERGHRRADQDQDLDAADLRAGEAARQRVDRDLGRERGRNTVPSRSLRGRRR